MRAGGDVGEGEVDDGWCRIIRYLEGADMADGITDIGEGSKSIWGIPGEGC